MANIYESAFQGCIINTQRGTIFIVIITFGLCTELFAYKHTLLLSIYNSPHIYIISFIYLISALQLLKIKTGKAL